MRRIKIIFAAIAVITVLSVCALSYLFAESLVVYEHKSYDTPNVLSETDNSVDINTVPENIPYSDGYVMYLSEGVITVYDSDNTEVYLENSCNITDFTASDIKQLEQDGIKITDRSELLEILSYISS